MDSLRLTDDASRAVQKTPNRVSLDSMVDKIAGEYSFTLDKAIGDTAPLLPGMDVMTVCVLVMQNGFIVIGKSAPADPANFNEELGRKFAREDAIRQLWPLEGYALREKLTA
jgi:hypothetical protein